MKSKLKVLFQPVRKTSNWFMLAHWNTKTRNCFPSLLVLQFALCKRTFDWSWNRDLSLITDSFFCPFLLSEPLQTVKLSGHMLRMKSTWPYLWRVCHHNDTSLAVNSNSMSATFNSFFPSLTSSILVPPRSSSPSLPPQTERKAHFTRGAIALEISGNETRAELHYPHGPSQENLHKISSSLTRFVLSQSTIGSSPTESRTQLNPQSFVLLGLCGRVRFQATHHTRDIRVGAKSVVRCLAWHISSHASLMFIWGFQSWQVH